MGLKHEAKKGTVIEISGPAKITVLRGAPQLEIEASSEVAIKATVPSNKPARGRPKRAVTVKPPS
jgi:hypothetical protein